jgi:uncharacterized protein YecT (DUF1311 family)
MRTILIAACWGAALAGAVTAQEAPEPEGRSWHNPEYVPVVEPLGVMLRGCMDQGYARESFVACYDLSDRACLAMGPGGDTTYGREMCATVLDELWGAELDRTWTELLAALPDRAESLKAEQAAWEANRDAAAAFAVARVADGSMASHVGGDRWNEMTAERIADFREILRFQ